jgi:carboxymethylenebutenolidase
MDLLIDDMGEGHAEAYVARPGTTGGDVPGVLLFMDAIGLRPRIRDLAARIADWGYVVLAPNLFHRSGTAEETSPTTDLRLPGERERFFEQVRPRMTALTTELSRRDTERYLDALLELPGVDADAPVGVVGYCMGVRLALRAAGDHPTRVGAVGGFHGGGLVTDAPDSPHRSLATLRAGVLLRHADHDASMPPEAMATLAETARAHGVDLDQDVYPDAPHGYSMADTSMYDESAAERHFEELRRHLDRHLKA